ncbi:MAG: hypothetical protein GEU80_00675 [Dehalococcoidia bacterium]|nr:hypothetical protein [Dehalococcoidia bacterium]
MAKQGLLEQTEPRQQSSGGAYGVLFSPGPRTWDEGRGRGAGGTPGTKERRNWDALGAALLGAFGAGFATAYVVAVLLL